jgi:hypothetical protein
MRNDARPIGEDSPASPVGGDEQPVVERRSWNGRDSIAHDCESPAVNQRAEGDGDDDATVRWQPRRSVRRSEDR